MTMPKFEPVAWLRDTLDGGLSTMTDCCTNVVKEIWLKANPKNVERYTAPLYTADQLTEAYEAGKQDQAAELEAARAEIERKMSAGQFVLEQLAAEQAKNVELRELVEHFALIDLGRNLLPGDFGLWVLRARKAISTPDDTSALEDIVKKAGEVMREKCADASIDLYSERSTFEAIHALPGVTLEDLK